MRVPFRFAAAFVVLTLLPAPAFAWGFVGHRLIMAPGDRSAAARAEAVLRQASRRDRGPCRRSRHVARGGLAGERSTTSSTSACRNTASLHSPSCRATTMRRSRNSAASTLERNGLLPWRLAEIFGQLRRGFEGFGRQSAFATTDVILFSAVDVPLHPGRASAVPRAPTTTTAQLTGQRGIHARFETQPDRAVPVAADAQPAGAETDHKPARRIVPVLLESYQLVDGILQADKKAVAGKETYDDEYYEKLFAAVKPVIDRRISEAISATASLIIGAWEAGGAARRHARGPASCRKSHPVATTR